MDQEGTDRERLLEELKKKLSGCCVDFSGELECSGAEAAGKKENPVDNSGKSPSAEGMQLKDNASEAEKENISGTQGASDKIMELMIFWKILPCVRRTFWKASWKQERSQKRTWQS
mgnify:CR=1 FL=1